VKPARAQAARALHMLVWLSGEHGFNAAVLEVLNSNMPKDAASLVLTSLDGLAPLLGCDSWFSRMFGPPEANVANNSTAKSTKGRSGKRAKKSSTTTHGHTYMHHLGPNIDTESPKNKKLSTKKVSCSAMPALDHLSPTLTLTPHSTASGFIPPPPPVRSVLELCYWQLR